MPDILKHASLEVLVVDGAMGTMLSRMGLPAGESPELLNVTAPEMIAEIHKLYVLAGADAVSTNTFGGTRTKLAEWGLADRHDEINREAVRIARSVGAQHVLADVGPTGLVVQPLGPAAFETVYDDFFTQVSVLAAAGPDAIMIETMTDINEARIAVMAARAACDLPVFCSVSFGVDGRMPLSGTDPATAAIILQAAGAHAVGMNCGLGPDQMLPLVERMVAATTLPVIAQPNAGMPYLGEDGVTVFPGTPEDLGAFADAAARLGAGIVGSCCGSSPAFTAEIVGAVADRAPVAHGPATSAGVVVAGPRGSVRIGGGEPLRVIGERINPTGKKALADSLREGSMAIVREFALEQQRAGADLLDVNVGAAGVDAAATLPEAIAALVPVTDLPLVIDTTDPAALRAALERYPGRALINSVNGGAESMDTVLPLAARFGAAVVILALDDDGIPHDVAGRLAIVERVRRAAHAAGLTDADLVVDALVLTAATDPTGPATTRDAVAALTEMGLATVLGVSNVSHGLPGRPELNAAFLHCAVEAGLTAAIANPAAIAAGADPTLADAAAAVIDGDDELAARWIATVAERDAGVAPAAQAAPDATPAERLAAAIDSGDADSAPGLVDRLVADGMAPAAVIGEVMTPAIQRLGDAYGRGEVFLPQMMVAAEAMKAGVARAKELMPEGEAASAGVVVFATVKGDIHSIGKDICVSLLESRGFDVRDLGVDVAPDTVVAAASDADAVCLSALMTTTLPAMEATVAAVRERGSVPVLVGGAVVTADWAATIGAGYSSDAPGCVEAVTAAIAGKVVS